MVTAAAAAAAHHADPRAGTIAEPARRATTPAGCDRTRHRGCSGQGSSSSTDRDDRDRDHDRDDNDHDQDDRDRDHLGGGGSGPCATTAGSAGALLKQVTFGGHTFTGDPGGLTVSPGEVVTVTISSPPGSIGQPEQVWDCLFVGHPPSLGGADLGATYDKAGYLPHGGPFTTSFTVLGKWQGQTICDRGKAAGGWDAPGGTLESNQFCFFVEPPAVVAETPWPALFVILPMLAAGIALVIARRRRIARAA
jgi:hypothetical protein